MPMQFVQEDWNDRHPDYIRCDFFSVNTWCCQRDDGYTIWIPRRNNERLYECLGCRAVFTERDRFPELFLEPEEREQESKTTNRWQRIVREIGKAGLILLAWIAVGCHDFESLSSEYGRSYDGGVDTLTSDGLTDASPNDSSLVDSGAVDSSPDAMWPSWDGTYSLAWTERSGCAFDNMDNRFQITGSSLDYFGSCCATVRFSTAVTLTSESTLHIGVINWGDQIDAFGATRTAGGFTATGIVLHNPCGLLTYDLTATKL